MAEILLIIVLIIFLSKIIVEVAIIIIIMVTKMRHPTYFIAASFINYSMFIFED